MRSKLGVAALVCVAAAVALSSSASASSGTLVITSNTLLTEDHQGSIVVARNGVTLDCAGHTISGAGAESGVGVELIGRSSVTVRDCRVTNFDHGFYLVGTKNSTFRSNVAQGNQLTGFDINDSSHNTFVGNEADGNAVHGFAVVGGRGNVFSANSVVGNPAAGFSVILSNDNMLKENVATANGGGFVIQSSSGNVLKANVSSGNVLYGFVVNPYTDHAQPENNTLRDNVAEANGWYGFVLWDASFNRVTGNVGQANGIFDAVQDGDSVGNDWVNNTFGTTFGI